MSTKNPETDSIETFSESNASARIDTLLNIAKVMASMEGEEETLEQVLEEAMRITHADGGTLYVVDQGKLKFQLIRNHSLGIQYGGRNGTPVPETFQPIDFQKGSEHVVVDVIQTGITTNIPNVYESEYDFSGAKAMDAATGYRSQSFLTVGIFERDHSPIGAMQLINAQNPKNNHVQPFTSEQQQMVEALAAMGGAVLKNAILHEELSHLLESFIQMIAEAVDAKSPYTGGHCRRVPEIMMDLVHAVQNSTEGPFADVHYSEADLYEIHVAALMHDIGKIAIPEYVVDKATKLETIYDRIHEVEMRFAVKKKEVEIEKLQRQIQGESLETLNQWYAQTLQQLDADFLFLQHNNFGQEYMGDEDIQRVEEIAKIQITINGLQQNILTDDFVKNLTIRGGTLTFEERKVIQNHADLSVQMLEVLPFPKHLRNVPAYAGGHHETMLGTGYPKGLKKDEMPLPARMLAVADVFEALTASDRPYKKAKTLSETMNILKAMKCNHHLDPDLVDLFVSSKVYENYSQKYMESSLIDDFDAEGIITAPLKPLGKDGLPQRQPR